MDSKIPVGILGATGSVGQKFIELLSDHPWFEIAELGASERSAGKKYKDATNWIMSSQLKSIIAETVMATCEPNFKSKILFSGLDSSVAGEIEADLAKAGYIVISNARNHRFDEDVPLIIPEVNADHLQLLNKQKYSGGIVTNPNCSTIGLALALKPIHDAFGLEKVNVVTMQAISGSGYPGLPSMDILENVLPYISGEEDKMESEPLKILGGFDNDEIKFADIKISAQCNRVPVIDGHTECVQVTLTKKAGAGEIIDVWKRFKAEPLKLKLPSAPNEPVVYFDEPNYPQPKLHRNLNGGMTVSVGRLREDKFFDYKFVILSHNTVRGAAGGTILVAELMKAKGYFDKVL